MAKDFIEITIKKIFQRGQFWNVISEDEEFFGVGTNKPSFNEGDTISFEYTQRGRFMNAVPQTISVVSRGEASSPRSKPAAKAKSAPAKEDWGARNKYWEDKEKRDIIIQKGIRYQSSRNAAIEVVTSAVSNGAISLGSKKAEQLDNLLDAIDIVTERFEKDVESIMYPDIKNDGDPNDPHFEDLEEEGTFE